MVIFNTAKNYYTIHTKKIKLYVPLDETYLQIKKIPIIRHEKSSYPE